ncbi:class I SAM-dependent methyltransferase [Nocardioides aurantiacus]|uniref:class I SAM-dependent methyltransferase n=1 Tax=Nocardioides aurantiacus TaxID=86796 RepID=UPI00403F5305
MSALRRLVDRVPGVGGWDEDPLWGSVYDWSVEHPAAGRPLWRLGIGSDLDLLYAAAGETGRLPAGSVVLDVPSGGGVALRGLRPGQGVRYVAVDISQRMLDRTTASARRLGVADQLETLVADVVDLPLADGSVDHVVSLTGLHCFPDPRGAVRELGRVLRPGGVLTGSALLNDSGLRFEGVRRAGRVAGVLGPGVTRTDVRRWLAADGFEQVTVRLSGAIGYFRGVRTGGA